MKWLTLLTVFLMLGCSQQSEQLSSDEIAQIKDDIIMLSEKHAQDLVKLDHKAVMEFYGNEDDFIIFGDGNYWGDYITVDRIWQDFTGGVKKMIKWNLSNHKIHVSSMNAASYLVEFDNERVESSGDTTKVTGCFTYGMEKIYGQWKAVTVHVTHNYKVGYGYERWNRDWWKYYSPQERKN
jgi:hypothetical protein